MNELGFNISHGEKHLGKSIESLFFKAPSYIAWMIENGVIQNRFNSYDDLEIRYFEELCKRASWLCGICGFCKDRPVTRMAFNKGRLSSSISGASLLCTRCNDSTEFCTDVRPSLYTEGPMSNASRKVITRAIKRHYIGPDRNLTQTQMEAFFRKDSNFRTPTPDFFCSEW